MGGHREILFGILAGPGKDWTDVHSAGWGRIRYHLAPLLSAPPSWEDLATERWAEPTDDDEPPGILAE